MHVIELSSELQSVVFVQISAVTLLKHYSTADTPANLKNYRNNRGKRLH